MQIPLPWPPTANTVYRHTGCRHLLSLSARRYRLAVGAIVHQLRIKPFTGPLALLLEVWPPDRRERDLDNLCKAIQDALQHGGAFRRDSQIRDLQIVRYQPEPPGRIVATLTPCSEKAKPCPVHCIPTLL